MQTLSDFEGKEVIDSRDLIEAMEYWQEIIGSDEATQDELKKAQEELKVLEKFCEPFVGYCDWEYGETLIHKDYWEDYVKDMLQDCGYIPRDIPNWIEIDWEATAENVAADYMHEGEYYMRCV